MNKSENINELAAALSKAQGQIKGAVKDSKNPFFKSTYATLASVWDACRDQLASNGLSVVQCPEETTLGITIETILCHSSGQWISSKYTMPVGKGDAQAVGSAITYGRRYALSAMVGISPDEDDGNAATAQPPKVPLKKATLTPESKDKWEGAKVAYKRDGNLSKVLARVDISDEDRVKLIAECQDVG